MMGLVVNHGQHIASCSGRNLHGLLYSAHACVAAKACSGLLDAPAMWVLCLQLLLLRLRIPF